MDRRRLIEAVSSAVIVSNLAGCGESERPPATTDRGDATDTGTADASAPRSTNSSGPSTGGPAETPTTAPLALSELRPGWVYALEIEGVESVDGDALGATDVHYTLNRLLDGTTGNPQFDGE